MKTTNIALALVTSITAGVALAHGGATGIVKERMDAMETITTRGPMGPGNIIRPEKVIVGTDKVAMDVYAAPLLGADPKNALQVRASYEHGLGEMDLSKVTIKEISTV